MKSSESVRTSETYMIRLRCALWERKIFQAFLIWGCTLSTRFIITFTNTASTFYLGLWSLLSCQADAQFHPFLGQSHGLLTTLPQNKPRVGGDVVVESKIMQNLSASKKSAKLAYKVLACRFGLCFCPEG